MQVLGRCCGRRIIERVHLSTNGVVVEADWRALLKGTKRRGRADLLPGCDVEC